MIIRSCVNCHYSKQQQVYLSTVLWCTATACLTVQLHSLVLLVMHSLIWPSGAFLLLLLWGAGC